MGVVKFPGETEEAAREPGRQPWQPCGRQPPGTVTLRILVEKFADAGGQGVLRAKMAKATVRLPQRKRCKITRALLKPKTTPHMICDGATCPHCLPARWVCGRWLVKLREPQANLQGNHDSPVSGNYSNQSTGASRKKPGTGNKGIHRTWFPQRHQTPTPSSLTIKQTKSYSTLKKTRGPNTYLKHVRQSRGASCR